MTFTLTFIDLLVIGGTLAFSYWGVPVIVRWFLSHFDNDDDNWPSGGCSA